MKVDAVVSDASWGGRLFVCSWAVMLSAQMSAGEGGGGLKQTNKERQCMRNIVKLQETSIAEAHTPGAWPRAERL